MNKPDFAAARLLSTSVQYNPYKSQRAPRGWRKLGSGISRIAYLSPDGWVYKVGNSHDNEAEYENSQRLPKEEVFEGLTFRTPETHLFGINQAVSIIAMEHVKRKPGVTLYCNSWACHCDCNCRRPTGRCNGDIVSTADNYYSGQEIYDIHYDNIIMADDGSIYIIDMVG